MWTLFENKIVRKQLIKCPKHIKKEYEAWKKIIELSGPWVLQKITGYKDHTLKENWRLARSSYLNYQWRVIYFIDKKESKIFTLEVTSHDYRKKN